MSSNKSQHGSAHMDGPSDHNPSYSSRQCRAEEASRLARFFSDQAFHSADPACIGSAQRQLDRHAANQVEIGIVNKFLVTQGGGTPKSEKEKKKNHI